MKIIQQTFICQSIYFYVQFTTKWALRCLISEMSQLENKVFHKKSNKCWWCQKKRVWINLTENRDSCLFDNINSFIKFELDLKMLILFMHFCVCWAEIIRKIPPKMYDIVIFKNQDDRAYFLNIFFYLSFIISFSWIIIINNNRNNNIVAFRFSSYLRTTNNFYSVFSSIILFLHFFCSLFCHYNILCMPLLIFFSFNLFTTNFFLQCFSTSLTIFCLFYFFFLIFYIYDLRPPSSYILQNRVFTH